jgi:hypothetical protein
MEDFGIIRRIAEEVSQTQNLLLMESYVSQPVPSTNNIENSKPTGVLGNLELIGAAVQNQTNNGGKGLLENLIHQDKSQVDDPYIKKARDQQSNIEDLMKSIRERILDLTTCGRALNAVGKDVTAPSLCSTNDIEVPNGRALLDAKGEFVRMVDDKYKPKDGERVAAANLISNDFRVEKIQCGENKGKYLVTRTVQAKDVSNLNYGNLNAKPVGEPKDVGSAIYSPDEWVHVKSGDKIQLVRAQDLKAHRLLDLYGPYPGKHPIMEYPFK